MTSQPSALQREIKQSRPFRSRAQEATLAVLRTADLLRRRVAARVEPYGLTTQQYNVLRILRGAGGEPLPTLEIGERMVEQTPGVTRLLDRLEAKGLVRRERCTEDRRLVHCFITETGLDLLRQLDPVVDAGNSSPQTALTPAELEQLIRLLDRIRAVDE